MTAASTYDNAGNLLQDDKARLQLRRFSAGRVKVETTDGNVQVEAAMIRRGPAPRDEREEQAVGAVYLHKGMRSGAGGEQQC